MIKYKRMSKRDLQQEIMIINERIEDISKWEEPDYDMIKTLRDRREIKVDQINQIINKSLEKKKCLKRS